MSKSIPPLDPRLLRLFRQYDPAPSDVRARARHRLLNAAAGVVAGGGGDGGGEDGGGEGLAAAGRARTLGMPTVAVACLAFVAGGAVGAWLHAAFAPSQPPRIVYVDRVAAPPTSLPAPTSTRAEIEPIPSALEAAPRTSSAPPGRASQLLAERILLDEARAELAQGDTARAIDRLDRHRRTYPVPMLGEERDAMWIEALVKAGRYDEARARAATFRRRAPHSIFSSMVESALEAIP
jgi:hypothetical protein